LVVTPVVELLPPVPVIAPEEFAEAANEIVSLMY